ncbi:MAG: hypothetical protein M1325_00500 [Actinobacteria bacterium]|nr:hypothetical protein [Actinomycetota bacterium]
MGRQRGQYGNRRSADLLKIGAFLLATALALLVGAASCAPKEEGAYQTWKDLQHSLADRTILQVELHAPGPKERVLSGVDAEAFSRALLGGTFSEDNAQNFGPTAAITILFRYDDRDPIPVAQWPDGRFEIRSSGTQFLVASQPLCELLRNADYVYP